MKRRILITVPIVLLFTLTALIFMAARAPRTWATHWSSPRQVAQGAGQDEFGAVRAPHGGWDLLWFDDDAHALSFSPAGGNATIVIQRGDIAEPSIAWIGKYEMATWIRDRNGATDLMGAVLEPANQRRVFRIIASPQPLEHPYLFAGTAGTANIVFSWQRYGNFEIFLLRLPAGGTRPQLLRRLTHAQYYSFYPRAVTDAAGNIDLLHLENCCKAEVWEVRYDRYDAAGRHLGRSRLLDSIYSFSSNQDIPGQWGEDIVVGPGRRIWGTFAGDGGAWGFQATPDGRLIGSPHPVERLDGVPFSLALAVGPNGGYVFWPQSYELGTFLDSQRLDSQMRPIGSAERVDYEGGSQTNPHAALVSGGTQVIWQTTTKGLQSQFQMANHRDAFQPTVAQRLGLGLGNPWQQLVILLVSSLGVATLTTMGNLLIIFGLGALLLIAMRVFRRVPAKWAICSLVLAVALYLSFVVPGGPILFLSTIPSLGLSAVPFGLIATLGALALMFWIGVVGLRRVEDMYRVGIMAVVGVYFFAFLEAVVFIQQRLGFI